MTNRELYQRVGVILDALAAEHPNLTREERDRFLGHPPPLLLEDTSGGGYYGPPDPHPLGWHRVGLAIQSLVDTVEKLGATRPNAQSIVISAARQYCHDRHDDRYNVLSHQLVGLTWH